MALTNTNIMILFGRITRCNFIIITLTLFLSIMDTTLCAVNFKNCTGEKLNECGNNQDCNNSRQKCECLDGFVINPLTTNSDDICIDKSQTPTLPPTTEGASWTVIVLVIFTISLLFTAAVLLIRKYNLIEWARQKWEARRNTSVMYEDVMIGQDDPPITA